MNISSNSYDYYYRRLYSVNPTATLISSNSIVDEYAQSEIEAAASPVISDQESADSANLLNMSECGKMFQFSLQPQEVDFSDIHEKMEAMKTQMDNLKSADIDSMSADEVKQTLADLISTIESTKPSGSSEDQQHIDLDNMSEEDMRQMLQSIQEKAKHAPDGNMGMPPMPPPGMGGFDPMLMTEDTDETASIDATSASTYAQSALQQRIDKLSQSYDSSGGDSQEDWMKKLEESLSSMFNKQKNSAYAYESIMDRWDNTEVGSVMEA